VPKTDIGEKATSSRNGIGKLGIWRVLELGPYHQYQNEFKIPDATPHTWNYHNNITSYC
jgi:hypothetical protein